MQDNIQDNNKRRLSNDGIVINAKKLKNSNIPQPIDPSEITLHKLFCINGFYDSIMLFFNVGDLLTIKILSKDFKKIIDDFQEILFSNLETKLINKEEFEEEISLLKSLKLLNQLNFYSFAAIISRIYRDPSNKNLRFILRRSENKYYSNKNKDRRLRQDLVYNNLYEFMLKNKGDFLENDIVVRTGNLGVNTGKDSYIFIIFRHTSNNQLFIYKVIKENVFLENIKSYSLSTSTIWINKKSYSGNEYPALIDIINHENIVFSEKGKSKNKEIVSISLNGIENIKKVVLFFKGDPENIVFFLVSDFLKKKPLPEKLNDDSKNKIHNFNIISRFTIFVNREKDTSTNIPEKDFQNLCIDLTDSPMQSDDSVIIDNVVNNHFDEVTLIKSTFDGLVKIGNNYNKSYFDYSYQFKKNLNSTVLDDMTTTNINNVLSFCGSVGKQINYLIENQFKFVDFIEYKAMIDSYIDHYEKALDFLSSIKRSVIYNDNNFLYGNVYRLKDIEDIERAFAEIKLSVKNIVPITFHFEFPNQDARRFTP